MPVDETTARENRGIEFQRLGGYRKCRHKYSLDDYLVIDLILYPAADTCNTFESNLTVTQGYIALHTYSEWIFSIFS